MHWPITALTYHTKRRGGSSVEALPRALQGEARAWLAARGLALRERGAPLGVCIMTADFWGLPSAGGTATAYHLLAQVRLGTMHRLQDAP
jgi:hypothetical protein